ncbi:MAG: hypothetical protein RIF41_07610 [Polyangiaceae bacterium]
MSDDKRTAALQALENHLGLAGVRRVVQRGDNATEARFSLEFVDGRVVHLGPVAVLLSQAKLTQELAAAIGNVPPSVPPADGEALTAAIFAHCVDRVSTHGETTLDTYRDWLRAYISERAVEDEAGAAPAGEPFLRDGRAYIKAESFRLAVGRQWGEQAGLGDVRQTLRDLGAEQTTVHWRKGARKSSTSYYEIPLEGLVEFAEEESGNAP